jgi:alkylation response protein AidB-like acyl-CoA dehydrogenase
MDFALSEEQEALCRSLRPLLETTGADGADTAWARACAQGWLGLSVSEDLGGQGAGTVELALMFHELGRALTPGPFLGTVGLALPVLLALGDKEQRERWVPALISGERTATLAVHDGPEPVVARATEQGSVLRGVKTVVPDGDADLLVIEVPAQEQGGRDVYIVERGPQVSFHPVATLDLGRPYCSVSLDDAPGERIGVDLDHAAKEAALDRVRIVVAAELVGCAERCLDMAVQYAKTRYQFGRPIGSFQATKHRCADMFVELELARGAVQYAAWESDQKPSGPSAFGPVAAVAAITAADLVTRECLHVHGGLGFTWEHDAHLYMRRARADSALLGGVDHQLGLVARRNGWVA